MALARRIAVLLAIAAAGLTNGHAIAQSTGSTAGAPELPAPQNPPTGAALEGDPIGACCLPDGHCFDGVTQFACEEVAGDWNEGDSCLDVACEAVGACCIPGTTGQCAEFTISQCEAVGGLFNGDGSTCASANCPTVTGACCFFDLQCELMSPAQCEAAGGRYQGNGNGCTFDEACPVLGACCLADGTCIETQTLVECRDNGGEWSIYMGYATLCETTVCTGACIGYDASTCTVLCDDGITAEDCEAAGRLYQGHGSTCPDDPTLRIVQCRSVTTLQIAPSQGSDEDIVSFSLFDDLGGSRLLTGVTILANGEIVSKLAVRVSSKGQDLVEVLVPLEREFNTISLNPPLATILPPSNQIFNYFTQASPPLPPPGQEIIVPAPANQPLFLLPGQNISFVPPDPPVLVPPIFDGSGPVNFAVTPAQVPNFVGVGTFDAELFGQGAWLQAFSLYGVTSDVHRFVGKITVIYEFEVDDTGACCLCDGTCTDEVTESECMALAAQTGDPSCYSWYACTPCDEVPVPCEPRGACCLCDGTTLACVTEAECAATGPCAAWYECTPVADIPVPCEPRGACCLCDGTVLECTTMAECLANECANWYQCETGNQIPPCIPEGACCLCDGSVVPCRTLEDCQLLAAQAGEPNCYQWEECVAAADVDDWDPHGACCLCDGTVEACLTEAECQALAAQKGAPGCYDWLACAEPEDLAPCDPRGVCCLTDGTVQTCVTRQWCIDNGGPCWAWYECATVPPVPCEPKGACCYCDGSQTVCTDCLTQAECEALECGIWYPGLSCDGVQCEPRGYCKLCTGEILPAAGDPCLTMAECASLAAGTAQPDCYVWQECEIPEPGALGACCDPCSEACLPCVTEAHCEATNWTWLGACSSCDDCPPPSDCCQGCKDRGSLIIIEKVELVWNAQGQLVQDTFIHLTNDYPAGVRVQMFFVNGDEPLAENDGERAHPGWNFIDNALFLTANQPVYWSAHTGLPLGLSPWEILDPAPPGQLPGRPSPEVAGERVLRGYIVLWAVDLLGREIHWNHLFATVKLIRYDGHASAWEYQACAFPAVTSDPNGGLLEMPYGRLDLDGATEYCQPNAQLLMNFPASGATFFGGGVSSLIADTDLTLLPADGMYLLNGGQPPSPPVTTTDFSVWNEAETKFGGPRHCIVCWDQTLLSQYGVPNTFLLAALQSNVGKARIDGVQSDLCPGSVPRGLLGVRAGRMYGPVGLAASGPGAGPRLEAGYNLIGIGGESAVIWHDALGDEPPGEAPEGGDAVIIDPFNDAIRFLDDLLKIAQEREDDRP